MQRFKWLTGDQNYLDYGGKWYSRIDKKNFYVIELLNWFDTVGVYEALQGGNKYNVQLARVSMEKIEDVNNALKSCGWQLVAGAIVNQYDNALVCDAKHAYLAIAEALHGYGIKDVLLDADGNNANVLMARARQAAQ